MTDQTHVVLAPRIYRELRIRLFRARSLLWFATDQKTLVYRPEFVGGIQRSIALREVMPS